MYSVPDSGNTSAEYLIAPMDVVEVTVFEAPNLSRSAQVTASGMISLPLIKDVRAAGKTTDELQSDIAARLAEGLHAVAAGVRRSQGIQQPARHR